MEKKKINLISFLLLCLVAIAIGNGLIAGIKGWVSSAENGSGIEHHKVKTIPAQVSLEPDSNVKYPSSFKDNNGKITSYSIESITANVENEGLGYTIVIPSLLLTAFIFLVIAIYKFIRLIRDITKGNIFIKQNYKRLKWVSWALAIMFLYDTIKTNLEYNTIETVLSIPGYQIEPLRLHWNILWVALVFALFAQIFALGIKMKEEQELTI